MTPKPDVHTTINLYILQSFIKNNSHYQNMWDPNNFISHTSYQKKFKYIVINNNVKIINKYSSTLQIVVIFEILEYTVNSPVHTTKM